AARRPDGSRPAFRSHSFPAVACARCSGFAGRSDARAKMRTAPAGRHPGARMSFDPTPWRAETEAVAAGRIHLNNAGASLMPRQVCEAVFAHLRREIMMGGYEAADAAAGAIEQAHEDVASLI